MRKQISKFFLWLAPTPTDSVCKDGGGRKKGLKHKSVAGGFTVIEILVVIAVIDLLASIITTNIAKSRRTAHDVKRMTELKTLQKALEMYYLDHGEYPMQASSTTSRLYSSGSSYLPQLQYWLDQWNITIGQLLQPYLNQMPQTVKGTTFNKTDFYSYIVSPNLAQADISPISVEAVRKCVYIQPNSYVLYVSLEDPESSLNDLQKDSLFPGTGAYVLLNSNAKASTSAWDSPYYTTCTPSSHPYTLLKY